MAVQYDPVDEIESLVHLFRGLGLRGPQVGDAARTRAELDLVLRDVDIDQLALPAGQRGAGADEYVHLRLGVGCDRPQFFPVEELLQPQRGAEAEDRVVAAQIAIFLPILQVRSLTLPIRQRKYIFLWKPPKTDIPTIWLWQIHQRTKHISGFPVSANAFH